MNFKTILAILIIYAVVIPSAFAQEDTIPDWVKGIAGWWAEDKISESEFINAMEFLVTEEIIKPSIVTELQNQVSELQETIDSAQKRISSLEQQLLELGTVPSDVDDDVSEPDLNTEKGIAAAWWAVEPLTDEGYIIAMQKLIDEGKIPPFDGSQDEYDPDQPIPVWVKNNVRWWINETISFEDYRQSIIYLFKAGILRNPLNSSTSETTQTTNSNSVTFDLNSEKGLALAWTNGQINDTQYIQKTQDLLDDGTILIDDISPQYDYSNNLQTIQSYIITVKATTAAWANGQISDSEYRQEQITYLFNNSILSTPERHIAKLWSNGKITDSQFIQQYQELIDKEIVKSFEGQAGTYNPDQSIPAWIKNNAGWWTGGGVSFETYRQSINFLYKEGFLRNPLN